MRDIYNSERKRPLVDAELENKAYEVACEAQDKPVSGASACGIAVDPMSIVQNMNTSLA